MTTKQHIVVRDRRTRHQFSIHNRVVDEWLPIIGPVGYAIYSLYVRMASRESEHCYPGYTLISRHLGIGRTAVSVHNKLLEWCRLIHIHRPGDNRPNEYYILDIPAVTSELLDEIRQAVSSLEKNRKFRETVLKRLDNWQSLQSLWERGAADRPLIVHPAQLSLPEGSPVAEHPSPVAEHPSPVAEHPSPVAEQGVQHGDSNNPKQQSKTTIQQIEQSTTTTTAGVLDILSDFGIQEPVRSQLAGAEIAVVQAWIWYAQNQASLHDPRGFVVKRLRERVAPPADLLALARAYTLLDDEERKRLCRYGHERRQTGDWYDHSDEPGYERIEQLFDVDMLETWYEYVFRRTNEQLRTT